MTILHPSSVYDLFTHYPQVYALLPTSSLVHQQADNAHRHTTENVALVRRSRTPPANPMKKAIFRVMICLRQWAVVGVTKHVDARWLAGRGDDIYLHPLRRMSSIS